MNITNDKSYVSMEQHVCLICTKAFDTGALLLDKRLLPTFDRNTVTGWGLCPEHEQRYIEGYIALVACENQPTTPSEACRTGEVAHLRFKAWTQVFSTPLPLGKDGKPLALVWCDPSTISKLKEHVA